MKISDRIALYTFLVLTIFILIFLFNLSLRANARNINLAISIEKTEATSITSEDTIKDLKAIIAESNLDENRVRALLDSQQTFYLGIIGILSMLIAAISIASIARVISDSELRKSLLSIKEDISKQQEELRKETAYLSLRLEINELYSNVDEFTLTYENHTKEVQNLNTFNEYISDQIITLFTDLKYDYSKKKILIAHDFIVGLDHFAREVGFVDREADYDINTNMPLNRAIICMKMLLGKEQMEKILSELKVTWEDEENLLLD
ncbi:hypothetical protein FH589_01825 (plasmid) [Leptospira interrogans]|uniref:hypothetical protein n=1 Tax=Leptospira interrogans TaxID=173 RepID=UPI0007743020|nr:hypothetical protein [Leptospira interrogans]KAA1265017.1 hypothetical protein C5473_19175 [Leptospira interrogans serovar Weerasinghe]ULG82530.1 hypothetical protein FH595_19080 [Leptospira interrogans]ULG94510.1 hypothetical protein FH584_19715 [Leptospira interrogans]ULG94539.1 hypothetical protein FH584_19420 [Leptospira interrogans]ULG94587.1 hypothetical protein FH584_20050 [Leptospira interrogans]